MGHLTVLLLMITLTGLGTEVASCCMLGFGDDRWRRLLLAVKTVVCLIHGKGMITRRWVVMHDSVLRFQLPVVADLRMLLPREHPANDPLTLHIRST